MENNGKKAPGGSKNTPAGGKNATAGGKPKKISGPRSNPVLPDKIDPDNLTEQIKGMYETGTAGMKRQIQSSIRSAYAYGEKPEGKGKISNFPNARMQVIEQDDEKRAFLGKVIANNLEFFKIGLAHRVTNDDELCDRLNWFFQTCTETQQLTTVEKLGLSLGLSVKTMLDIENGTSAGFSPATKEILRTAKNMLAAIDAEMAAEGRIQPVVYLFRSKNFYGMKDQQDVVVTPNNPLGDYQDARTIAAKYDELPE
jgi:hypothetical protein